MTYEGSTGSTACAALVPSINGEGMSMIEIKCLCSVFSLAPRGGQPGR